MHKSLIPILRLFTILCAMLAHGQVAPVGGEISYKYLYNTGDYEVTMILFQTENTNTTNQPVNVLLNSTCYGRDTLHMVNYIPNGMIVTPSGGVRFSANVNCGDTSVVDSLQPLAFFYKDTVTLPGKCSDYSFSYQQCCRDSVIDNIVQPENTTFFIRAKLNNTLGPNTSPEFYSLPRFKFYKEIVSHDYGMVASEPNNDSIWYKIISAKDSAGVNVNYDNGFSASQPFPSQFPFQYGISSPTKAGEYIVVVETEEYRIDSVFIGWFQVGSSIREVTYFVSDSIYKGLVSSAFGNPDVMDTIRNVYCDDTIISFGIESFYAPSLIPGPGGGQFRLIGMDSIVRPIVGAGCYNVNSALMCDSIWLKLHKPLAMNDTVFIQMKKNGGLVNSCGNELIDSVLDVLIIKDCQLTTGLDETPESIFFSIYPNPAKNKITLEFEEGEVPESISIYNLQGAELKYLASPLAKIEIDLSKFAKGMYLIKVSSGSRFSTKLFQKN